MTLTQKLQDIHISGEYKQIMITWQVFETTDLGDILVKQIYSKILDPDDDISDFPEAIQRIAEIVWTDDVKSAWQQHLQRYPNSKDTVTTNAIVPTDSSNNMIAVCYDIVERRENIESEPENYNVGTIEI